MIRNLRRKFILINMSLVGFLLLIAFSIICYTSYQQQKNASYSAMRYALGREAGTPPERFVISSSIYREKGTTGLLPVFSIFLDAMGNMFYIDTGNVTVSDDVVLEAAKLALEKDESDGVIRSLNLRFMRQEKTFGVHIAFVDRGIEQASMGNLLLLLLFVGIGGMFGFFLISLFLSGLALGPVEKAWMQQRQFVADASHELKTPLTIILANLGIVKAHPHDTVEKQGKWIENTHTEATRMKKLVEDLLYLAKSDATQKPSEVLPFSLSDAIWNIVLPFEPFAFELGVTISSHIAPDIEICGNEAEIKQVLVALLDNACKYARKDGSVEVTLEKAQDKAQIIIKNTGDPIPPEDLPHLFERFYRADKARAREQGGYGLGLAIAAQIVSMHKGQIDVESNETIGTWFTVSLPLRMKRALLPIKL